MARNRSSSSSNRSRAVCQVVARELGGLVRAVVLGLLEALVDRLARVGDRGPERRQPVGRRAPELADQAATLDLARPGRAAGATPRSRGPARRAGDPGAQLGPAGDDAQQQPGPRADLGDQAPGRRRSPGGPGLPRVRTARSSPSSTTGRAWSTSGRTSRSVSDATRSGRRLRGEPARGRPATPRRGRPRSPRGAPGRGRRARRGRWRRAARSGPRGPGRRGRRGLPARPRLATASTPAASATPAERREQGTHGRSERRLAEQDDGQPGTPRPPPAAESARHTRSAPARSIAPPSRPIR